MSIGERALEQHAAWHGKIEVVSRAAVETADDLAVAYTPGVAAPCLEIQRDPDLSYTYTRRGNLVAVITDGSAVLGLGNIGPVAGMPVMEGKCALFKSFAGIDAFPLCVGTQDVDELVETIRLISGSFGGINLEDISAPRCFEVERRLKEVCDIPIFHDDQHGTAIVASAALINACRLTGRELATARIVFSGAGAAGISIASLMLELGARDIVLCDVDGALYEGKPGMNPAQERIAAQTNPRGVTGSLADALADADVFAGVSVAGVLSQDMVRSMASPSHRVRPRKSRARNHARRGAGCWRRCMPIRALGLPNQINNVSYFPACSAVRSMCVRAISATA